MKHNAIIGVLEALDPDNLVPRWYLLVNQGVSMVTCIIWRPSHLIHLLLVFILLVAHSCLLLALSR